MGGGIESYRGVNCSDSLEVISIKTFFFFVIDWKRRSTNKSNLELVKPIEPWLRVYWHASTARGITIKMLQWLVGVENPLSTLL